MSNYPEFTDDNGVTWRQVLWQSKKLRMDLPFRRFEEKDVLRSMPQGTVISERVHRTDGIWEEIMLYFNVPIRKTSFILAHGDVEQDVDLQTFVHYGGFCSKVGTCTEEYPESIEYFRKLEEQEP